MITVAMDKVSDTRASIRIEGHAGAEKVDGVDLVCAYMSGAVDFLMVALRDHVDAEAYLTLETGKVYVEVNTPAGVDIVNDFADFAEEVTLANPEFVRVIRNECIETPMGAVMREICSCGCGASGGMSGNKLC